MPGLKDSAASPLDAMPDADLATEEGHPAPPAGRLARVAFLIGSFGLLTATATDSLAVLGRHTGFTLLGSIEIVQLAVVLAASSAMVGATLLHAHASVHIVVERLSPAMQARLARLAALLGALLFALIAGGSAWVLSDLWAGHERTELLGLPLRWFRLVWIGATALIVVLFLRQAFAGVPAVSEGHEA